MREVVKCRATSKFLTQLPPLFEYQQKLLIDEKLDF